MDIIHADPDGPTGRLIKENESLRSRIRELEEEENEIHNEEVEGYRLVLRNREEEIKRLREAVEWALQVDYGALEAYLRNDHFRRELRRRAGMEG